MTVGSSRLLLLLVGAGAMAEGYLEAAQEDGISVAVVETEKRLDELRTRYSCIVDFEPVQSCANIDEAWITPSLELADRCDLAGVLAFAEPHVVAAAIVKEKYGLAGPGMHATAVSRNKSLQRSIFRSHNIGQPDSCLVNSESLSELCSNCRYPVIVKPLSEMGSVGVSTVSGAAEWPDVINYFGSGSPFLVEEYIDGPEFSVEALICNSSVIFFNLTKKTTTGSPAFVELSHEVNYGGSSGLLRNIARKLCERVNSAMRIETGIIHLEFKARRGDLSDLAVMEAAVRTPGDHVVELISRSFGFNLYRACLSLSLGNTPDIPPTSTSQNSVGVGYLISERQGVLESIDVTAWDTIPEIKRRFVIAQAGDLVAPPLSSSDRLGYAIVEASSSGDLQKVISRLQSEANIVLADPDESD